MSRFRNGQLFGPPLDTVLPISAPESRFAHVIKHLYDARECWDMVIGKFPADPLAPAVNSGCELESIRHNTASYFTACEGCKAHVLSDHDRFYAPAYLEAVASSARLGWQAAVSSSTHEIHVVGENAVYAILKPAIPRHRHADCPSKVVTAYRVRPHAQRSTRPTAEDFLEAALDKLADKTDFDRAALVTGNSRGGTR